MVKVNPFKVHWPPCWDSAQLRCLCVLLNRSASKYLRSSSAFLLTWPMLLSQDLQGHLSNATPAFEANVICFLPIITQMPLPLQNQGKNPRYLLLSNLLVITHTLFELSHLFLFINNSNRKKIFFSNQQVVQIIRAVIALIYRFDLKTRYKAIYIVQAFQSHESNI